MADTEDVKSTPDQKRQACDSYTLADLHTVIAAECDAKTGLVLKLWFGDTCIMLTRDEIEPLRDRLRELGSKMTSVGHAVKTLVENEASPLLAKHLVEHEWRRRAARLREIDL